MQPASPMPTPIRAANRGRKLVAAPEAAVISVQAVKLPPMIHLRLARSAQRASGTDAMPPITEKASPVSRPSWVSLSANSFLIGSMNIVITTLSTEHMNPTTASAKST